MRTFAEISNEQLLIEAIRRLRTIKVLTAGRKAPEGTDFEKILSTLSVSGFVSNEDLKQVLNAMLVSGEILITGHTYLRVPAQHRHVARKSGIITRLHPDAKVALWQYFTESGTPIVAKHRDGKRIYPNEKHSYWTLVFKRIYFVGDGLPASTQTLQKRGSAQPY